ncbi:hypothetical protein Tdes44962_MAKER10390 [Teratosphaeria destructans]|uniref:Uncharacterized protein n=1 Tax=Teratosphaeria destructans TaxID=418781 RepID=A0A9W7SJ71_9PEZI|nr:hypothetical protein Tdes44962_MAKER10390 [Teratosphaeria destructans]
MSVLALQLRRRRRFPTRRYVTVTVTVTASLSLSLPLPLPLPPAVVGRLGVVVGLQSIDVLLFAREAGGGDATLLDQLLQLGHLVLTVRVARHHRLI